LNDQQPKRKKKHGLTVFIPRYQENGNVRDKSGPWVMVREPCYQSGRIVGEKAGSHPDKIGTLKLDSKKMDE
jgi:hypothetical protein